MRCLKNKDGYVYPWTEMLALRSDMVECNLEGSPVGFESQPYVPEEPPKPASQVEAPALVVDNDDGAALAQAVVVSDPAPPIPGEDPNRMKGEALRSHLRGLGDKLEIEKYAKDRWDFDLDRRRTEEAMIDECLELAAVDG